MIGFYAVNAHAIDYSELPKPFVRTRLASVAEALGIAVVMLDVLDCGDPDQVARRLALYTSYGFAPLPSNGLRLFLPMATVRMLIA